MSLPSPAGGRQHNDDIIRIAALTVNTLEIRGQTFSNCKIIGPAVLVPQGRTSFVHCNFEASGLEELFWDIPEGRTTVVGAVALIDCTFSGCSFTLIGIAGGRELREMMVQTYRE